MLAGWGKLNNLAQVAPEFRRLGHSMPENPHPLCFRRRNSFGGIMLILGLFTRIPAAMLAVVMVVAIRSAKWGGVRIRWKPCSASRGRLFRRLHVARPSAGPGAASLDRFLANAAGHPEEIDLEI